MKKFILSIVLLIVGVIAYAGNTNAAQAEIKFITKTHNFGEFSESKPKVSCTFKFTNSGNKPLIIYQAIASCGCTVPKFPKEPIKPGESGEITVTYNGAGKFPGKFKKSITVRSNASTEITRLTIEGNMTNN